MLVTMAMPFEFKRHFIHLSQDEDLKPESENSISGSGVNPTEHNENEEATTDVPPCITCSDADVEECCAPDYCSDAGECKKAKEAVNN
ncbi:hypothetical protein OS493_008672 [Desmophyllum pertusum]|uniref:Uncharacterized protein n=1 Tax=Desmophyllum pertusum TaxID=174260 RepID=A0A9W9ZRH7_9CNID|nr:hypothetical protein OS493_008672 [Desmophyllum pertusum]